ncbi:hypothetical protein HN014_11100 [Aquimarina sp. TRL1]|uniref:VOC family protein n=1 Tax=Aquimarina sp. (strain TRL1) TaxID=2736252 RepID=UPI00158E1E41|nr:VOC family protein [Aquimarina sp. TRL1]QKX05437.1 hypothetical protein HN014_11100 [Aquimarina sp. TRL1]
MKFKGFSLHINHPEETLSFYQDIIGFRLVEQYQVENHTIFCLESKARGYDLELIYNQESENISYAHEMQDNYWKYSLFVDDIKRVYHRLNQIKHTTGEAYQFGDIGYLMHTADTESHKIEFIQKTFEQHSRQTVSNDLFFLKEQPVLGLLTIRTKDPVKMLRFFESTLGLKLFVRMYVEKGEGFTLYFLGDRELVPPNPDIDAIENREWMYQQNHLFIEIQYYWGSEYKEGFDLCRNKRGLKSINFVGNLETVKEKLLLYEVQFVERETSIIFNTLDAHEIIVTQAI